MKKSEYERRINEIVKQLSSLMEQDRRVIQPQSSKPVTIDLKQLLEYGKRYEERQRLHGELQKLAAVSIDD